MVREVIQKEGSVMKEKQWSSYTYGEARVGTGEVISFSCAIGDVPAVKAFLEDRVRKIELPSTHATNVSHGGYGMYSRYNIKQHKYGGGGPGFVEVLEILNPPADRHPFVMHYYTTHRGHTFSEWQSIEAACKAFQKIWGLRDWEKEVPKIPGFMRLVRCGPLSPWFYAIGEEGLVGDYALPYGLEDDPVFRLGRKFVVQKDRQHARVRICMGSRLMRDSGDGDSMYGSRRQPTLWREAYFDDGSLIKISEDNKIAMASNAWAEVSSADLPRPLRDEEAWITEAIEQFENLLAGQKEGFQIKFTDGSTFTAKLSRKGKKAPSAAGDYYLKVTYNKGQVSEGWVNDWKPTQQCPDIVSYVHHMGCEKNMMIERVQIVRSKLKAGGKKWSGVFFTRPPI